MSIHPYRSKRPLDDYDLEIAVGALFGTGRAQELTAEQKAKQETALAPYLVNPPAPGRSRSGAARASRLKALARKATEGDEAQS